ncbi:hypothetical protein [Prochlorococcus sp. MIT 1306]|uniref:hypothetical protein n=1 Tax=Prochlorococcus sp. MIT 1306 TaxID=1799667 RepID=UPI0007B3CC7D|nr:hypothetical protein [Prochlorococcus sp. MIT 1306]KZR65063.1 hypothetical protein PMIT1306_00745 [Prochlorococcus sp. MIT 1306]
METQQELRVLIEWENPILIYSYIIKGQKKSQSLKIQKDCQEKYYIFYWLLLASKDFFFTLKSKKLLFGLSKFDEAPSEIKIAIEACINRINNTQKIIRSLPKNGFKKHDGLNTDNILWLGAKDLRSLNYIDMIKKSGKKIYYTPDTNDFDQESRNVVDETSNYLPINQLLQLILSKSIGMVISINWDYIQLSSTRSNAEVYLILKELGVKFICIYNDPQCVASYGPLLRKLYQPEQNFINLGILHEYCDDTLKEKNLRFVPLIGDYKSHSKDITLEDTYEIIIATNSRINDVRAWRKPIIHLFEYLHEPYSELPIWYLSSLNILNQCSMDKYHKSIIHRNLWSVFYGANQYIKHQLVRNIETIRKVTLFGDQGWKEIAPIIYKGSLDQTQLRFVMQSSKHLIVLMNSGFSYLDHTGAIYDAMQLGSAWINLPTISNTKSISGLSDLEYRNNKSFNYLLNNAHIIYRKSSLRSAIKQLKNIYRSGIMAPFDYIVNPALGGSNDNNNSSELLYDSEYISHRELISEKVGLYTIHNRPQLEEFLTYINSIKVA